MGCGLLHNAITWVLCSRTIVGERQVSSRMTDIANVPRQNRTPSLHFRGFTVRTDEPEDVGNQEEKSVISKDDFARCIPCKILGSADAWYQLGFARLSQWCRRTEMNNTGYIWKC